MALFYDERMMKHRNLEDSRHPEQPRRVERVMERLEAEGLAQRCQRLPCREATREELELKHTAEHVDAMMALGTLDEAAAIKKSKEYKDVFLCPDSTTAGLLSAGAVLEATEQVCSGKVQSAVCVVRPPGHHAEREFAQGFCMFGNVAVAAAKARSEGWSKRTVIVDFDVHHGNGTQHMFEEDSSVLFLSLHRFDDGKFYPSTQLGNYTSDGVGPGAGFSANVPWDVEGALKRKESPPGDAEALYALDRVLLPVAKEFDPDLVIVSAGFDAARGDPLGGCQISPKGYYEMMARLQTLAGGRLVVALEGGYQLDSCAESMAACVRALLGEPVTAVGGGGGGFFDVLGTAERDESSKQATVYHVSTIEAARRHLSKSWKCLRPKRV